MSVVLVTAGPLIVYACECLGVIEVFIKKGTRVN